MTHENATKRPWFADGMNIRPAAKDYGFRCIAACNGKHEEASANAALIAQAINEFDALVEALEMFINDNWPNTQQEKNIVKAQSILNRIRGEQK